MPGGQFSNHCAAVRLRALGVGDLECKLISLDEVVEKQLADLTLSTAPGRLKTQNTNFNQQKYQLELKLTVIDTYFIIKQIIIYNKPVTTGYPQ